MRIILLHISDISGHRSASLAIEKAVRHLFPQCQIRNLNAFHYVYPRAEKIINFSYLFLIQKLPFIWSHLYDNPFWIKRTRWIKEIIYQRSLSKLKQLFFDFKPEVVCCTQAFPCGIAANFKRVYKANFSLIAVLTDYVPHSYWVYDNVDYYIVPSEEVKQRLINKGISKLRIRVFGIPIEPRFSQEISKEEARKKLGLNPNQFTLLVMGGGQGLGPIKLIVENLLNLEFDLQIIVVCGTNIRLYDSLNKIKHQKSLLIFGYVNNIFELMSAADIAVTKPGGITTAEALAKGLPLIIVKPIPGQEENNTNFLISKAVAVKLSHPKDIAPIIEDFYLHPEELLRLSESARRISKPNAAWDIAQLLLGV